MKAADGKLLIYMKSAAGLTTVQKMGKQDPEAYVSLKTKSDARLEKSVNRLKRTHCHNDGGKSAFWGEWLEFEWQKYDLKDDSGASLPLLHIEIKDNNKGLFGIGRKAEDIGSCRVDTLEKWASLMSGQPQTLEIYDGSKKAAGKCTVQRYSFLKSHSPRQKRPCRCLRENYYCMRLAYLVGICRTAIRKICRVSLPLQISPRTRLPRIKSWCFPPKAPQTASTSFSESGTGVPLFWESNQILELDWDPKKGKKWADQFVRLHVQSSKSKKRSSCILPLQACAETTQFDNVSQKWLSLSGDGKSEGLFDKSRLCVAWLFVPATTPADERAKAEEDFRSRKVVSFNDPPLVSAGEIVVRVLEAQNLKDKQFIGTSDPWLQGKSWPEGEVYGGPKPCFDELANPTWDWSERDAWKFHFDDISLATLQVDILDGSNRGAKLLATANIVPKNIKAYTDPKAPLVSWHSLQYKRGQLNKSKTKDQEARVKMEIYFVPDGLGKKKRGWSPAAGTGRPIPFFEEPAEIQKHGMFFLHPIIFVPEATTPKDAFVHITLNCGDDSSTSPQQRTNVRSDLCWQDSEPLQMRYTPEIGQRAIAAGSTPFLTIRVGSGDTTVGTAKLPLLAFLRNPSTLFWRYLSLTEESSNATVAEAAVEGSLYG